MGVRNNGNEQNDSIVMKWNMILQSTVFVRACWDRKRLGHQTEEEKNSRGFHVSFTGMEVGASERLLCIAVVLSTARYEPKLTSHE